MIDTVLETEFEELDRGNSFNHSYVQVKLGAMLVMLNQYTVCSELSLDISKFDVSKLNLKAKDEMIPDLCLYPKRGLSEPYDILRMSEMPLLAIEIISPRQGIQDILEKFGVYFETGVKSCWLVDPLTKIVAVYHSVKQRQVFSLGEVIDDILAIRLPIADIFS